MLASFFSFGLPFGRARQMKLPLPDEKNEFLFCEGIPLSDLGRARLSGDRFEQVCGASKRTQK